MALSRDDHDKQLCGSKHIGSDGLGGVSIGVGRRDTEDLERKRRLPLFADGHRHDSTCYSSSGDPVSR